MPLLLLLAAGMELTSWKAPWWDVPLPHVVVLLVLLVGQAQPRLELWRMALGDAHGVGCSLRSRVAEGRSGERRGGAQGLAT